MGIRKLKNITEMGKKMDCKLLGIRTGIKKVRSITKMREMGQEPFGLKYKNKTTHIHTLKFHLIHSYIINGEPVLGISVCTWGYIVSPASSCPFTSIGIR